MLRWIKLTGLCVTILAMAGCGGGGGGGGNGGPVDTSSGIVVFGYNDLGMHCMNQDFSEVAILPPFNTMHAQVIQRGESPHILTSGITVSYSVPGNTRSTDKTNFWDFAAPLFGTALSPNIGLTGHGLSGTMTPTGDNDWSATGIPVTPMTDAGVENPFQLASVTVQSGGNTVASTQAVIPVSWEINCNLCHKGSAGVSVATDILQAHDRLHGTDLVHAKPVLCAKCHAEAPLGAPGNPGLPSLSRAMHGAHAGRMGQINLAVACYACHPGVRTQCLRDVHFSKGMVCTSCHGDMTQVASASRQPWVDEPHCSDCHNKAGFQFEESGKLFRQSRGHHGVHCEACHGEPHAIAPSTVAADNVQAIALQGAAGTINKCTVCHTRQPDDSFPHTLSGGD